MISEAITADRPQRREVRTYSEPAVEILPDGSETCVDLEWIEEQAYAVTPSNSRVPYWREPYPRHCESSPVELNPPGICSVWFPVSETDCRFVTRFRLDGEGHEPIYICHGMRSVAALIREFDALLRRTSGRETE